MTFMLVIRNACDTQFYFSIENVEEVRNKMDTFCWTLKCVDVEKKVEL